MGVNKVIYNNNTLIDITDTTAEQSNVLSGKYFYNSSGNRVVGTLEEGITPSGTLDITENGTYDVANYASANVNVASSGYIGLEVLEVNDRGFPTKIATKGLTMFPQDIFRSVGTNITFFYYIDTITFDNNADILQSVMCRGMIGLKTLKFKGKPSSIANDAFYIMTSVTDIYVPWNEGEVANAPWGCTKATIHYNYSEEA